MYVCTTTVICILSAGSAAPLPTELTDDSKHRQSLSSQRLVRVALCSCSFRSLVGQ
ncbi:uncharacterized protein L969DRAFT_51428 [Mixia osmundae IAM 14324]|uniref:Uncharacterized protein n=1 Tax=Mixia osmundae (strain CBS 9802 / IAM 14324 / JCM 22182 / KY 12970) TaxID=764103 RepID=G7DZ74_MIXOS|nr:uncharacterized protein L969DRAFT_51428 [Mixia osmundae IAM 14324]KEI38286.1 hypothetical protein L969DRAFT_51428 [Mixia osmundae IAM 14324]GAA95884.1 hypothetical protein E5Q_02542 [Mixia osmundae IAM 14324]